jgi:hypothetical protein
MASLLAPALSQSHESGYGTLDALVAGIVRKEPRAAPVPALRPLPLRERSSHAACRPWAARFGREPRCDVAVADRRSVETGRRVGRQGPLADRHDGQIEQARRRPALTVASPMECRPRSPVATASRSWPPLTSATSRGCGSPAPKTTLLVLVQGDSQIPAPAYLRNASASSSRAQDLATVVVVIASLADAAAGEGEPSNPGLAREPSLRLRAGLSNSRKRPPIRLTGAAPHEAEMLVGERKPGRPALRRGGTPAVVR